MNRRLLTGFLTFAVLVIVALEVPFGLTLANDARSSHVNEVVSDASSLGYLVGRAYASGDPDGARDVLNHFALAAHAIVVMTEGSRPVITAGIGAAEELADPATRAILAVASRGRASGEEGSYDPDDDLLYAAAPLVLHVAPAPGEPATSVVRGVLLVATPAGPMHDAIRRDVERLVVFGIALLALAALLGTLLARSLTRPLAAIEAVVEAHGRGELDVRADEQGPNELRAHARTVNEMAARIEELLVAQRSFAADAAHQLRSPLTALRLRLENVERRLTEGPREELEASIAEADRLSRVIDGILTLARADGVSTSRVAVDVTAVLAERADAWHALSTERGVSLEVGEPAPRRLHAEAGPGFLEQVLDNLLANALDATPSGGTIRLGARRVGAMIEVHVVDTGIGMSDDERAHAFDRFWRGAPTGDGTGLGLAIVAQLVRASGGTCHLEAAPGGGTDAVVALRPVHQGFHLVEATGSRGV